jgi:aminoglycoside phosphotransferase family enzyme/predicted kinase
MTAAAAMETARALIAALLRPDAYPHAVSEPIRVAETHISWVLLTGDFAYKIKKPIKLSFLDYSTLERRRQLCEEELRLNRRLAPGLYVGVSAIGGTPGLPRIDCAGPPLEYAVRMRQFAPGDELSALLATSAVTPDDVAALGAGVARFHAAAAAAPAGSDYGCADTAHRVTMDNFTELRALPEAAGWESQLSALESRVSALHRDLRTLMDERRAVGRVRECHGDLHCGNVVRWSGTLTPFDGIEFEPALRFIDVINDIAFLTMDLAERGRVDLRRSVLQAWAETSGDWNGLPLLPYYEAYRALVRAKVDALRALQLESGSPVRAAAITDCRRYLDWAAARVAARRPMLLVTCGLSGSGKTRLARRLAAHLGALHLRSDVERKRLAGLAAHEDSRSPPDAGIYTLEFNDRTYGRLRDCAAAALAAGEPVIVDAAFLRSHERRSFLALARGRNAAFAIVHCHAPDAVLRDRVSARAVARNDASEAGLDVLARQPSYWEAFGDDEQPHVVAVDTSDTSAVAAATTTLAALTER